MGDCGVEQGRARRSVEARQNDQAGMDGLAGDEGAEVGGVRRHDHEVALDAALQDGVVGLAEAAVVARMHGQMHAGGVQVPRDARRKAFVDEETQMLSLQALGAACQGRPLGLPRSGWVAA